MAVRVSVREVRDSSCPAAAPTRNVFGGGAVAGGAAGRHPVGLAVQADEAEYQASVATPTVAVPEPAASWGVAAAAGDTSAMARGSEAPHTAARCSFRVVVIVGLCPFG